MLNILILGYGEMGHAMDYLLADRHHVNIWERAPKGNRPPVILEEAVAAADIVLFCLPVNPHRKITEKIAAMLKKNSCCLSIAKGLDESGRTAAQIFEDVLGRQHDYALLYGPMISEEIRADRSAFAQIACHNESIYKKVHQAFSGTRLYVEYTRDINGTSWSVILKNVYALVFGMADELKLGDNMRGYLAVAALREMDRIVRCMGGELHSSYHLAGLGDLITTATSAGSHHHELGGKLARGERDNIGGEGVHTLEMIGQYQLFNTNEYPLFSLIRGIVKEPRNVRKDIDGYLNSRVYPKGTSSA